MTKVTTKTIPATITEYTWQCPGCKRDMYSQHDPDDDLLCAACDRIAAIEDFKARFAPVIGAHVLEFEPPDEIYNDDDVKSLVLLDAEGHRWLVTCDCGLYVYRVNEDGSVEG